MCDGEDLEISNKLIKQYLPDELGESIQVCGSHRKNQSEFVVWSKLDIKDIANIYYDHKIPWRMLL